MTRRSDSLSSGAEGGGTAQELFGNCAVLGLLGMGAALGLLVRTLLVERHTFARSVPMYSVCSLVFPVSALENSLHETLSSVRLWGAVALLFLYMDR